MRNAALLTLAVIATTPLMALAAPLQWNGPMRWDQVIARAQNGGFDARLAAIDAQDAQAQAAEARAALFPQVGISGTALNSTLVQLGMPSSRQTYASLNATLPIFAPQAWASSSGAQADASAAQAQALVQTSDAVLLALQLYDKAALASAIVDDRQASLRDQRAHLVNTQQLVRVGKSARYVAFRDLAGVAAAQQSLADAQSQRDQALSDLAVSLDLSITSRISAVLPPPQFLNTDAAILQGRAMLQRPEVLAAQRRLTAAADRVRAARAAYVPNVSVAAQTYTGVSNPPLGPTGSQIAVTATLPLMDGGTRSAKIRQAQLAFDRAQLLYDRMQLSIERDVSNALREFESAQTQLAAATAGLKDAAAQFQIAELRERAGKAIELETLDALATQATARENVSRAMARYDDAVAAIHHAVGDYASPFSKGVTS